MKVLFATSEAYPFAISGGLGDVAFALPKQLCKKKVSCRVIMPLYGRISDELRSRMNYITSITVPVSWRQQYCGIFEARFDNVTYIFLDNEYYFKRGTGMYGEYDDAERFAFFSRAVLECIPHISFKPDIIHCNDWQTALIPVYLKLMYYNKPEYENIKTIMTIHNIQYQGRYGMDILEDVLGIPSWADSILENSGDLNMLKGGIEAAHSVTTVSPSYSEEILDPWYSHGLDGILKSRKYKLRGILNGIDYDIYNPEDDKRIAANYSSKDLSGKAECKIALQKELGLPIKADIPIISMVTRLADHKGLELVRFVFDELMDCDIQFIILGSGEKEYEMYFFGKSQQYSGKFIFKNGFYTDFAHRIYAGSDIFLMPSKQEPCGLSQMVALRYGTVPVVRKTGGLADTITDAGDPDGVGFNFLTYNAHDMAGAVYRALALYNNKKEWLKLIKRGMQTDNSWSKSADEYVRLYKELISL